METRRSLLKYLLISLPLILGVGCASSTQVNSDNTALQNRDKYENFNRAMFAFNKKADQWVLKPITKGYVTITPDPVETGVSNFFDNLGEIQNVVNDILQWKWKQAGNDTGRFLINSTVGIAGLFDVAKLMALEEADGEDFGQTMAVWGVPQGPYLVLPLLGPYTVSEAAGMPLDWQVDPLSHVGHRTTRYSLVATRLIDVRAGLFEYEELISGDEYVFIRDSYLQRRDFLVKDGAVEDDFGGFGSEEEFDF